MSTCDHATDPCDVCAEPDPVKRRVAELRRLDGDKWLAEIARVCAEKAKTAPPDPYQHPAPPPDLDRYGDRFGGR